MLAIAVETINKQTQQTNKQPQRLRKITITISHNGLENKQPQWIINQCTSTYMCTCTCTCI